MTPDQQHIEYFEENPTGNHDKPSRKTLELLGEMERRVNLKIEAVNDKKVDKTAFWTYTAIAVTIMGGMFGLVWNRLEKISENTGETREVVATIQGQLEPFDFIIDQICQK